MSGHAAEEIGAKMASVQEELQRAAAGMSAPTVMVPGGMTRAEFKEWKAAQTEKAKARLKDLEERLQRLQLLETKMQRLKTSSNEAIDAVPDHWTLPGTADNGYGGADEFARSPAHLGGHSNPGMEDSSASMQAGLMGSTNNGGVVSGGARNGAKPMYARPLSPSVIRQIIREELSAAADESVDSGTNPVKDADRVSNASTADKNKAGDSSIADHAGTSKEVAAKRRAMVGDGNANFASWLDAEQVEAAQEAKAERDRLAGAPVAETLEREPATIDDAVAVSCPLIFGGFTRRSPIRQQCFDIKKNLWWQGLFLCITIANSLWIALAPEINQSENADGGKGQMSAGEFWFDVICAGIMGFEIMVGIIAYGFVQSKTTFLRNSGFHRLDFACFLATVLEYVGQSFNMPNMTLRPFRMLRTFKPITKIKSFSGVKSIIVTISEGAPQLGIIFMFMLLTIFGWTIFGMAVFSKSFRRRCVTLDTQFPVCASDQSTGNFGPTCNFTFDINDTVLGPVGEFAVVPSYPFEEYCDIIAFEAEYDEARGDWIPPVSEDPKMHELFQKYKTDAKLEVPGYHDKQGKSAAYDAFWAYPKDKYGRWHTCQRSMWLTINSTVNVMCEETVNPSGGFAHFDNFWGSICSIAQVVVPDSYYDVLFRALQSEPNAAASTYIFFFFVNVFDTFLLLGLFVAVVTGTFKRIREKHGNHSAMLTEDQQDALLAADIELKAESDEDISGEEAMQRAAVDIVNADEFVYFISLTIVTHMTAMAVNTYDAPAQAREFATIANMVCTFIFVLEVTLNYIAAGSMSKFWAKLFHQFELFLVIMGLIGLLTESPLFRLLAALRGYRLMKYFPTLQDMLKSAVSSVQAILNVLVFIVLVMLCFVVAVRYMFGNKVDELSRSNFGSFSLAALTMFQLLTGDSWSAVMYSSMQAYPNEQYVAQFFGASLVVSWFVFASLIGKNLFVAVIIENFQIADTIENISKPGKIAAFRGIVRRAFAGMYKRSNAVMAGTLEIDVNTGITHPVQAARHHLLNMRGPRGLYAYDENVQDELRAMQHKGNVANEQGAPNSKILEVVESVTLLQPFKKEQDEQDEPERVLFCLMPNSPIRQLFLWISNQPAFDAMVYAAILVSCFFLIVERPYEDLVDYPGQEDTLKPLVPITSETMAIVNTLCTWLFSVEFLCRVMAQGLILTKNAYLKSGWNIVDTVVLVFAWVEEMLNGPNYKALRMGRALKPLRLMKRNQSMRVVIDALISTLQPLVYVILFLIFTLFIFSLMAMGLFGGKLHSCNDPSVAYPMGKADCVHIFVTEAGVVFPSSWDTPYTFGFDTYADSLTSLFQVSTFKYVSILYACMDVTAVDKAPKMNNQVESSIFFVIYILMGGLFVMNLFVAFIIDGFNANKGSSNEEMIYGRFRRQLRSSTPKYDTFKAPQNRYSRAIRKFIESPFFQTFSTSCVVCNVCFLLADNADAEPGTDYRFLLDTQNTVFFSELCFEVVLCLFGYGPGGFYNDLWRGFDLFVCLGQTVGLAAQNPTITRAAKVFRLARVVRLAARIKSVRVILETFVHTVPQLTNILVLIFLFYSMAAVMGVSFFATTKFGARYGKTANFNDYINAFRTIWQIVTGDEWHVLMKDLSVMPPFCTMRFTSDSVPGYHGPDRTWGDCGGGMAGSLVYFLIVKVLCEYMLLNLFIGLILDNFSYITEDVGHEEDASWTNGPSGDQLKNLAQVFMMYDKGTGWIPIMSLHALLCDLPLPLGYRKANGGLRIKPKDLAIELLVRGELNLGIRHEREMVQIRERAWTKRLARFLRIKKPEVKKVFINAIDYEVLMVTLFHWRVPHLVPKVVKWQRQERVEECALVAHALQCVEFFRMLVGRRKRRKIGEALAKRSRFMHWCDHEPHRKRHNVHFLAKRMEQKDMATDARLPMLYLLNMPADTSTVVLDWLPADEIPENFLYHTRAAREYHMMRVPQPITGIEVFRQKALTHYVVMNIIDPTNKDSLGDLVVADFTRIAWREWHAINSKHETYFEPTTWAGVDDNKKPLPHVDWDRVDLYLKSKSGSKVRQRRLGSIEDFQSFVIEDPQSTAKRAADRAVSHVRVNLGNHLYTSDKIRMRARVYADLKAHVRLGSKMGLKDLSQMASQVANKAADGISHGVSAMGSLVKSGHSSHGIVNKSQSTEEDLMIGDAVLEIVGYMPFGSAPVE